MKFATLPRRDTTRPRMFTATGSLTARGMTQALCTGTVRVVASTGSHRLAKVTTTVRWVHKKCIYRASLKFRSREHATHATVSARYLGSSKLQAVAAPRAVTVKLV